MKLLKTHWFLFSLILSAVFISCGGGGDSNSGGTGTVAVSLTDAMSNKFNAVYVTIEDVQVHMKGNGNGNDSWRSVSAPNLPKTFNLYELTNGIREEIGLADPVECMGHMVKKAIIAVSGRIKQEMAKT